MEGEKDNCSTFYVPGAMSDVTIVSTPLPQAASTATRPKRRSKTEEFFKEMEDIFQPSSSSSGGLSPTQIDQLIEMGERHNPDYKPVRQASICRGSSSGSHPYCQFRNPKLNAYPQKTSEIDGVEISSQSIPINDITGEITESKPIPEMTKIKSGSSEIDGVKKLSRPVPSTNNSAINSRSNADVKDNLLSTSVKVTSTVPILSSKINNFSKDSLDSTSHKQALAVGLTKYRNTIDLTQLKEDRISSASTANSSLGVIDSHVLDEVSREPLVDVNQDLKFRLAQKLNLDTSLLKDGMDVSTLASERYKEKMAAKCQDNKENQTNSGRSSSDYWTLHGYSSDNSDSRNNTAKRLSTLSTGSDAERKSSKRHSSPMQFLRPKSEIKFTTHLKASHSMSGRSSVDSNPFHNYSNVSLASEDFQFDEDPVQRLERDERKFSIASSRSLSGIYGDANASVNVNGEKLSMSSFLRSGSYPLGSLETGYGDWQSPQFGMPAKSPEKSGRPKAILPLPNDKSTFVVEEEPVRDTPWAPHSLMEQYSNIHNTKDATDADTSVPSLSYIDEMLEKLHQGANPQDILTLLMDSKTKNKPDNSMRPNRISSAVVGENSFCKGIEAELSFSAKDESAAQSFCNITDFGGDEEACVCVMTPQSMEFDVINELHHPVEYSFTKACYVNGQRKDDAAYIHFPVSKLMLFPGQKQTLTINIAALVGGVIKIKIGVARRNPLTKARECSNVYGKIVAEIPRVSLMTQHKGEMIPDPNCEYDGKYQHVIVMKNEGRSTVPLRLTVSKMTDEDDVKFHFGESTKTVTVMLEPGQMFRQLVLCETSPVFAHMKPPGTIIPVYARVEFSLATTDLYQLNPIAPVTLVAPLKPYFFGVPPVLVVPTILSLYNGCAQSAVFKTAVAFGYTVQPVSFTIPPYETFVVTVSTAEMKNPQRCGDLTLHVSYAMGSRSHFTVQLREGQRRSLSPNNSLDTPHSSRAPSPSSPSHSSTAPVGELKVACSVEQLVWGGCHLHQRVLKAFCLKNKGSQREKLRLTVSNNCFKIVGDEDTLQSELKLSLQPMENREVKLAALATVAGPQWGHLTISRINCAADKNVLPLNAFGGKAKVKLGGIFEIEEKNFLFLNDNNLQGSFSLHNSGDNTAFFRISEANSRSSTGLTFSPREGLLDAGRTTVVHISFFVTAKRLEYLLRQSAPSVDVAQLSIHWGDEGTRQRLLQTKGLQGVLAVRVSQLSSIPSCPIANLDMLRASVNAAEGLWEEDMDYWAVGVFVKRNALEALRLDTSEDYVDLSKTISKPNTKA